MTLLIHLFCLCLLPAARSITGADAGLQMPKPQTPLTDVDRVLADLRSNNEQVRTSAATKLKDLRSEELNLNTQLGNRILRAAATPALFDKPDPGEVSADLVGLLVDSPRAEYVPIVEKLFDGFSDTARSSALALVSQIDSQDAAQAYMRIVRAHAKTGTLNDAATEPLRSNPRFVEILFPELLTYAKDPKLSFELYHLCLAYCEAGLLKREVLTPFTDQVLESYREQARQLWPLQQAQGTSWLWEDPYSKYRSSAALLIDLLGYFPAEKVEEELQRALRYRDPRLKYFAVSSLMHLGKTVQASHIEEIAAAPEMRNWMYDRLHQIGKEDLFPQKYRTQEAFAESNMVDWLCYPTELGQAPDKMELMKVVPMDLGPPQGLTKYYVFRFRVLPPHPYAKDGWLAGVAGPFAQKEAPTTNGLGHTFSAFEKSESKSPEEHVRRIRDLIEEQWKNQDKER